MHYFPQMGHDGCISIFRHIGEQYGVIWWYCGETWPNKTRLESTDCCAIECVTKLMKADDSFADWISTELLLFICLRERQRKTDHYDAIKWRYFPCYWPFVRGIHRSPVTSPRTNNSDAELWCFHWSAPWINAWVNNREAGDLRRHRSHYDIIAMSFWFAEQNCQWSIRRSGSVESVWCQY